MPDLAITIEQNRGVVLTKGGLVIDYYEVMVLTKGRLVCRFGIWDCLDFPPPVGKAGFDVWVLTKGGISLYQHAVRTILCMVSPTCKYAHLLFGRVRPDPVMCVY